MYPDLPLRASGFFDSSATPTGALVAAPGAGKRLRLIHARVALETTATGNLRVALYGDAASPGTVNWRAQFAASGGVGGTRSDIFAPPEPGIDFDEDEPITFQSSSSIANQEWGIIVYYFIDDID